MQATISVDGETDARLDRLSSSTGRSKSDLVRDALIVLEEAQSGESTGLSAFDLISIARTRLPGRQPRHENKPLYCRHSTTPKSRNPRSPHHVTRRGHLRTQPAPAGAGGP